MQNRPQTPFDENCTIAGLLTTRAEALGPLPFVAFEGQEWTYTQTLEQSRIFARALSAAGGKPADNVAMMVENRLEFFAAWFGTALAAGVHVPLNPEYRGEILRQVLLDIAARYVVVESHLLPNLLAAMEGIDHKIELLVILDHDSSQTLPGGEGWQSITWERFLENGANEQLPEYRRSAYELGAVMLTSGTTGVSKGVMVCDKHAITQGREAAEAYGIQSDDVMYTCLPLFHANAAWSTVLAALQAGAKVALSRRFSARRFWKDAAELGATQVALLGTMLHMLVAQPPSEADRAHRVRIGNSVPCPPDVMIAFERRFGVHLLETYGNTETKRILSNRHYHRKLASAGYPTPTSIVEIHDENGWQVPPGVIGEMVYRPKEPGIMTLGYLNKPEATLSMMRNGWWCTGDLAWQDTDGFVYFAGRKKDAWRRRGENVSAFEVERALMSHPGVLLAAVVAAPSELSEDEILAAVVRAPGSAVTGEEVFKYADENLPHFMVPRYIAFVDSLPETTTGKIAKAGLSEQLMQGDVWDSESVGLTATRTRRSK